MYSAQQALIDEIKTMVDVVDNVDVPVFKMVSTGSVIDALNDQELQATLPACAVAPIKNPQQDNAPQSISGDFEIVTQCYAITVIIPAESDVSSHENTEAVGGALMQRVIEMVNFYRPTGFNDCFSVISGYDPAPAIATDKAMAAFTRAVKIMQVIRK
jgi:hypothetical protein